MTFSCFAPTTTASTVALTLIEARDYPQWRERQASNVHAWLDGVNFRGEAGASTLIPDASGNPITALAIIGDRHDPASVGHLPTLLPPRAYRIEHSAMAQPTLLLGWGLGAYRFERYLRKPKAFAQLAIDSAAAESAQALAVLQASYLVRDLINTPTEHMGPDELQQAVEKLGETFSAKVRTISGDALLAENFPAIHAVGRASHRSPRLIELQWGDAAHPKLSIVGKGVCFDTGGLDIKPADGMRNMKKDMGGAAHAIGLAQLVMAQQLPVNLQLLIPAVENAIGPNAYRPGEVIATRQGISVEIDNTDAEGRIVLCDALTYACESNPALIIDFATLTGAARIALGPDLPALFCNDEALATEYLSAGERERDPLWRMPLWRPYLTYLKSTIADLANSGASRMAGSVTAALYLERFITEGQRWSHVDVYSWNDSDRPGKPAGGEAQGLRAAFALVQKRFV